MSGTILLYDKNGTLLMEGDFVSDGRDTNEIGIYYNEWYIVGERDMWKIEQFDLDNYKDGIMLNDFELSSRAFVNQRGN